MSLFGTGLPTATAPNLFGSTALPTATTTNLFGSTLPTATTTPNLFGSTIPTATSAPALFGTTLPAVATTQNLFATAQPPATMATLFGTVALPATASTTVSTTFLSGTQVTTATPTARTPKEMEVPAEIMAVVEVLKQRIKENREMAEEIAAADPKTLEQLDSNYRSACAEYGKAFSGVQKVSQAAKSLKAESRQDLLDGEVSQRLRESLAINFDYAAPLNYLLRLTANYEKLLAVYAEDGKSSSKI